jgi:hypothetical protein
MTVYDPEKWLETTLRGIKDYVTANLNTRIYEIVMEFPGPKLDDSKLPIRKSIIHFEIDDIVDRPVGLGDDPMEWNYDVAGIVNPQWAAMHQINFDVGIWTSDDSGGTTARMRAKQELQRLFGFPPSVNALRAATNGGDGCVEIIRYTGGSFTLDTINDVRMYRMVNGELDVRVFSRTPLSDTPGPAIEEIVQSPGLTIIG